MCYTESLQRSSIFSVALRALAVVAILYGGITLAALDSQPKADAQSPSEQVPPASPSTPGPGEEQTSVDAAKPSEKPEPNENPQKSSAPAQEAAAASTTVPAQFFHGTITHYTSNFVTVSRTLVGKRPESRRFRILRTTKVHRALRVRAKVTVRYKHLPEGDVALEIQIHAPYVQKS